MPEQYYRVVPNEAQEKTYRCKVIGKSDATLYVGRRALKAQVRETSGAGFTIGLPTKLAKKIRPGDRYELHFDERRIQVIVETQLETAEGEVRFQLGIIREYEPKERWSLWLPFLKSKRIISYGSAINSSAAYGGFVLVLFCVMALPGVGDHLGTAPRIEKALKIMGKNIGDVVHKIRG